ncbi:T9SS type A sorting domain-containing protein [Neolewinella antarctica]|uniref:Chitodextrinase n=1 Tax=Neolewinella antarctica TaxID=442734 RepID=A0ABX0XD87_9BACT|nr:T9SS type A sorting domain-containing protein [Neolewinella antarctica]NJC26884.1 chitodextrinase [Neolewinella antarctica]
MKFCYLLIGYLCCLASLNAQVTSTASSGSGSGYPALLASGFQIEDPDCVHQDFGPHVTQTFDAELDRNVFVFHSHIAEDNDRCLVFDRVRMEIKGSATTIPELRHAEGVTSWYRWKFRLDENFVGASSFNHLYQNKAVGGDDTSFPILTITARANRVELKHDGGDTGSDLGTLAQAPIGEFRGRWVEGYIRQVHAENGELEVTIKDMATGQTILEYTNTDIDLWRAGATLNRPKWGVYRSKNSVLRDEQVRFANFCVSESAESFCPGEAVVQADTTAPTAPANLVVTNTTFTTISLSWDAATDDFGVVNYQVFRDDVLTATVVVTDTVVTGLAPSTSYGFYVRATDAAGNVSEVSESVDAMTDDGNAVPDVASDPSPADEAVDVNPQSDLGWTGGDNTVDYEIFFGTSTTPPSVATQTATNYQPELAENTTYYWRIESRNQNGSVSTPTWRFTTGSSNNDFPWQVFRGNARLETETNFWSLNTAPDDPLVDEVVADPVVPGNNFYGFRSTEEDNFKWRYALNAQDSTLTIVARIKGVRPDVNSMTHIDVRAFGYRQKVRINKNSIKLERSSPTIEADLPFNWNVDFHVIRIVVNKQDMEIYLDEAEAPFLTGRTEEATGNTYVEFGKSGGADYGTTVDWLAINPTDDLKPGEGASLPTDLIISSDASLLSISVDGKEIESFSPDSTQYVVNVSGPAIPTLTFSTGSTLATAEVILPTSLPDTAFVVVTAQDGFTSRTYAVYFGETVRTFNVELQAALELYPNPAQDLVTLKTPGFGSFSTRIYSLDGRAMTDNIQVVSERNLDVSKLPKGIYFLVVQSESGRSARMKLMID